MTPSLKNLNAYGRGELAPIILTLLATASFIVACAAMPGLTHLLKLFDAKDRRERSKVKRVARTLAEKRLIKFTYKNGIDVLSITENGRKQLVKFEIDKLKIRPTKQWDGKWRVIMFDIPERMKKMRNEIHFRLTDMGFVPYQKSAFISPFECKVEVDALREYFALRKYIKYMLVNEIDDREILKRKFFK